jgi:hypothetical protein
MLRSIKDLTKYTLGAQDGRIGHVEDFYFDDTAWMVRYVVLDTGRWLPGRRVLLTPASLERADWKNRTLQTGLTKQAIEDSPPASENKPISRQQEQEIHEYYGWHPYWMAPTMPGAVAAMPIHATQASSKENRASSKEGTQATSKAGEPTSTTKAAEGDPHLRSVNEVLGYAIEATDGSIGVVDDFVLEDDTWTIRYMVIDTHKWLPGKRVLVAPPWIDGIDWSQADVRIDLTREQIRDSPRFDPDAPINREYETRLYDYYGRPRYWEEGRHQKQHKA